MLKLRAPRNAYDLLGLPRSATPEKIRARYWRLVRNYRRGTAPKQLLEDEQLRRWTNAYLLLTGPERREYDGRLRQNRGEGMPGDAVGGLSEAGRLAVAAEVALGQRRLNDASELAKEAVKQDSRNAAGYALLGEILREQGKYNDALKMYNYAIQFDPNKRSYWHELQEVTALQEGRSLPSRYRHERATLRNRPLWVWATVAGALAAIALSTLYLRSNWGAPGLFDIPSNLIYAALAGGLLMGVVLAATSVLMPFDDEMLSYQVAGFGMETTPIGIFVGVPGVVFFWTAPLFYAIVAYLDEYVSPSIVIALSACAVLTAWFGFLSPKGSALAVYLLIGNFVFFGFAWGWLFGSIRRRVFAY
jgi:tetratricopeptide (TPR) repeat protein